MEKTNGKAAVKFFTRKDIPLEMHKVRIVQSLKLVPVERRLEAMKAADSTPSSWALRIFSLICLLIAGQMQ